MTQGNPRPSSASTDLAASEHLLPSLPMDAYGPPKATASNEKKGSKKVTASHPQRKPRSNKPAVILPPYASSKSQPSLRETVHSGVHLEDSISFVFDKQHQRALMAEQFSDNITSEKNTKQAPRSYADIVRKGINKKV